MEQKDFPNFNEERLEKQDHKALTWLYVFLSSLFILVIMIIFARMIFYANYKYYPVRGTSMQPTINPDITAIEVQDGVFVKYNAPMEYGDIIIIKLPSQTNTIIKRVIAKEGDKVCIRRYPEFNNEYRVSLIRGGSDTIEVLEEGYIKSYQDWSRNPDTYVNYGDYDVHYEDKFYNTFLAGEENQLFVSMEADGCLYYKVTANNVFYLGDNRSVSKDARENGTTDESGVVGVVKVIVRDIENNPPVLLWWKKFQSVMGYFFEEIGNFFAWKY